MARRADDPWIGAAYDEDDSHRATWLAAWEAGAVTVARPRQPARSLTRFPVSILETIRPERLKESLRSGDDSLAARFLFAWPGPQPYRALAIVEASRDEEILQRLRALSRLATSVSHPCVLSVDTRGRAALDEVLAQLHAERQNTEGLEAAWIGKSRSLIVRLAGLVELLTSIDGKVVRPGAIGAEQVEAAAALWRDYYWPHAKAVFDSAELSDYSRRVRRVARWLLEKRPATVSREEIRRRALSRAPPQKRRSRCCSGWPISASSGPTCRARGPAAPPAIGCSIRSSPKRQNRLRNLRNCPNSCSSGPPASSRPHTS